MAVKIRETPRVTIYFLLALAGVARAQPTHVPRTAVEVGEVLRAGGVLFTYPITDASNTKDFAEAEKKAGIVSTAGTGLPNADVHIYLFASPDLRRQASLRVHLDPELAGYVFSAECGLISVDFTAAKKDDPKILQESRKAYQILNSRYGCSP